MLFEIWFVGTKMKEVLRLNAGLQGVAVQLCAWGDGAGERGNRCELGVKMSFCATIFHQI